MAAVAAVLREDDRGIPRSLPLFAALVDVEARRYAAAASQPAKTGLVRAFRGGAAPQLPIRAFLERIHLQIRSEGASRGLVRIDGTCFVLAGVYLTRFIRSPAGREAGILIEPATAHRLVAVALFLGAKFGGHPPNSWTAVFEASSGGAIRAAEMADLEGRFLRAIDFRLFVNGEKFEWFCKVLEREPPRVASSPQRIAETLVPAATMAAAAAVLREDDRGIPRSLHLFAASVDAEARRYASVASQPAKTSLVRAFRGGATPKVSIHAFLESIHLQMRSEGAARGLVRIDGTCFVLAGVYLTRFLHSPAGREAGILLELATAHRLVAVSLFLGAKFGGHPPRMWTVVFEASSGGAIRAAEMADLECRFLRAIDFRLFVDGEKFEGFCKVLERGPRVPSSAGECACMKRQADVAAREEDEHRRVRARLPLPAVVSH